MKKITILLANLTIVCFALTANARDTLHRFSLKEAMNTSDAQSKLNAKITFSFGTATKHKTAEDFGEYTANKKTNAFNKSDKEACMWAFLSAMISLQERAQKMGGDAVVDITSYYKRHLVDSADEYECGAGAMMAGVTLKGRVVKLKK